MSNEPPFNTGELYDVGPVLNVAAVLELYAAARAVVDEWGDGDEIDPDRMDGRIERLRMAADND
jgi:hypothetical protein